METYRPRWRERLVQGKETPLWIGSAVRARALKKAHPEIKAHDRHPGISIRPVTFEGYFITMRLAEM